VSSDKAANKLADKLGRRKFLSKAMAASFGLVAGLFGNAQSAKAEPRCPNRGCCCVAYPNGPHCHPEYVNWLWTCCRQGYIWVCEEGTGCSNWYQRSVRC